MTQDSILFKTLPAVENTDSFNLNADCFPQLYTVMRHASDFHLGRVLFYRPMCRGEMG